MARQRPTEVDMETCSWCTAEVPDSSLRETDDGARICPECRRSPDAQGRMA